MSLVRLALRIATVQALLGRTMVADAMISDSAIAPIDDIAGEAASPFIVVYTDDGQKTPTVRDILTAPGTVSLVIEFAFSAKMRLHDKTEVWGAPETDEGMERILDQIERQILVALTNPARPGEPGHNPWSLLWRALVIKVNSLKMERGASAKDSPRFAARQLAFEIETVCEPPFGAPPDGVWDDLLALMREERATTLPELAARFESLIVGAPTLPQWQVARQILGADAGGLGLAPVATAQDGADALLRQEP